MTCGSANIGCLLCEAVAAVSLLRWECECEDGGCLAEGCEGVRVLECEGLGGEVFI